MDERTYGSQRVSVELTNICNLHCSYCLRDEDALYHTPARFFPVSLLQEIARQGREAVRLSHISLLAANLHSILSSPTPLRPSQVKG